MDFLNFALSRNIQTHGQWFSYHKAQVPVSVLEHYEVWNLHTLTQVQVGQKWCCSKIRNLMSFNINCSNKTIDFLRLFITQCSQSNFILISLIFCSVNIFRQKKNWKCLKKNLKIFKTTCEYQYFIYSKCYVKISWILRRKRETKKRI